MEETNVEKIERRARALATHAWVLAKDFQGLATDIDAEIASGGDFSAETITARETMAELAAAIFTTHRAALWPLVDPK